MRGITLSPRLMKCTITSLSLLLTFNTQEIIMSTHTVRHGSHYIPAKLSLRDTSNRFTYPNGIEQVFKNKRGGEIARATGFSIDKEHDRYKT